MILQNSTDVKTEIFYDENKDPALVDVRYEKHIVNPNGLIQLQNIPSPLHTVFDIRGKDGVTVIKYNKVEVISNKYDFTVDYINGILTFHNSQKGKEVQISYTNSIGRLSISADRIFTGIDNQGNITQTLGTLLEEGRQTLSDLEVLGGATKVITEIEGYIESIKQLTGNIIEGENVNTELKKSTDTAKSTNTTLNSTINNANNQIDEMNSWVESHSDIVNLDNRVDTAEIKLDTTITQLADITSGRFKGKKYVQIGDSITVGFVDNPYCSIIAKNLGMTLVNLGVSGSAITKTDDRTDSIYERRASIPEDAGIIAIAGGTNDFGHNSPMGSLGQVNSSGFYYNFYGAYYNLVKWIQENRPNAQIVLITPTHRENENVPNEQGYILEDYVNVIRDIGKIFSIPVLDFYADGSINPNISQHKSIYATDGLHPLQNWHDILGQKGTIFMRGL